MEGEELLDFLFYTILILLLLIHGLTNTMAITLRNNVIYLSYVMTLLLLLVGDYLSFLCLFICQADIMATPSIPLLASISILGVAGMACSNVIALAVVGCMFAIVFISLVLRVMMYGIVLLVTLFFLLLFVRGCIGEVCVCYSIFCSNIVSVCICISCILVHCAHIGICILIIISIC